MKIMDANILAMKFRGSLLGSLIGDCYGAPFEGDVMEGSAKLVLRKYFDKLEGPMFKAPIKPFTDDTAMTKSVIQTLIEKRSIDQTYLATNFVKQYYNEPNRGYGGAVIDVFKKLRKSKFNDVLTPAKDQFNGEGSFGNGGAMRVAPVALFNYNNVDKVIEMARQSAELTHTHKDGINGTILQALAVYQGLNLNSSDILNPDEFINSLLTQIEPLERETDEFSVKNTKFYQKQLNEIKRILKLPQEPSDEEIINVLGHSIAAMYSVPTAIYCFLKSNKKIAGIQTENPFRRTIEYAISLGGDTDTIASMAGAIAGAYYGDGVIAPNLIKHCESHETIIESANSLFTIATAKP